MVLHTQEVYRVEDAERKVIMNGRHAKMSLAVIVVIVAALVLSSCGGPASGGSGRTRTVEVGNGQKVKFDPKKPMKIALFIEVANNSAVQSSIRGAKAQAKKLGVQIDVFDPNFDSAEQVYQMQNALLKDYNAWVVAPVNGEQVCNVLTKQAPQRGIIVSVISLPICGRSLNEGEKLWAPGTLDYIGGNETPDAFKAVMEHAIKDNPGPQKVGILTGPDLHPITLAQDKAIKEVTKEHPNFKVVSKLRTDYSPPDSQQKTQTMIQAHPDINMIFGTYSTMSKGAVPALKAAGMNNKVKVYENGGTVWSVNALKKGDIQATTGYYRATAAETAVQAIADARKGKKVPRVVLNDGHKLIPGQKKGQVGILTRENLKGYKPESP